MQPNRTTDTRRTLALALLCSAFFMVILDVAIVNVALPSMQADLDLSQGAPAVGRERVRAHVRRPAAARRPCRRPAREAPRSRRRRRRCSRSRRCSTGLAPSGDGAGDGPGAAGARSGHDDAGGAVDPDDDVPPRAPSGTGRSASGAPSAPPAGRSGCSSAASLTRPSAGSGSSSSTCPIGAAVARPERRCCSRSRGRSSRARRFDVAGAATVTAALSLLVYALVGTVDGGLDVHSHPSASLPSRRFCSSSFVRGRTAVGGPARAVPPLPACRPCSHSNVAGVLFGGGRLRGVLRDHAVPAAGARLLARPRCSPGSAFAVAGTLLAVVLVRRGRAAATAVPALERS